MSNTLKKALHYCLFLLILGIICGGMLALVNSFTSERIKDYQEELVQNELKEIFGSDSSFPTVSMPEGTSKNISNIYHWIDSDGELKGVVYKVVTSGYGGDIVSIIAFSIADNKVLGFKVISASSESRGNATEFDFGFVGDAAGGLSHNNMSGATITSTAVSNGANIASKHFLTFKDVLSVRTEVGNDGK